MRGIIISGGAIDDTFLMRYLMEYPYDYLVTADKGLEAAHRMRLKPNVALGDFDSVKKEILELYQENKEVQIFSYPSEKDETDTELAIKKALEAGCDAIHILGGTGSRIDHVLGNISLLYACLEAGVDGVLVDVCNRIRLLSKGSTTLKKEEQYGKYVSLIPLTSEVGGLTMQGMKYNVEDFTLSALNCRGVSNEIEQEEAVITFKEGILILVESTDGEETQARVHRQEFARNY